INRSPRTSYATTESGPPPESASQRTTLRCMGHTHNLARAPSAIASRARAVSYCTSMEPRPSLAAELRDAFLDGLTRPRASALAGILIVLCAQALAVSPRFLARLDPGYLGWDHEDTGTDATLAAMRLRARPPGRYTAVILGNSPLRE